MRIRIEVDPIGPLKILPELPQARLAILEGLNGIGKTLAVRLLELCTGTLPYPMGSPAWNSLRNGLGEFHIVASDLRGGREIQWFADSRDWEQGSKDGLTPVLFRDIKIDGSSATLDDVRPILAVHRIGGDEGLIETLAQQADAAAGTVRRWARRYADQNVGPLARLEDAASKGLHLLGSWSLELYRDQATSLEDSRGHLVIAGKAVEEAQQKRDDLVVVLELSQRLGEMRRRAPNLTERLLTVDQQIEAAEAQREELQYKVRSVAGQVAAAQPLLGELRNARRTLERNRQNLSDQLNDSAVVAAALGTSAEKNAVSELISQLEDRVAELVAEQATLDAAPMMRSLLDKLTHELTQAEHRGLGYQIAVDEPDTEVQLTVAQTRAGMATRRAYLEGRPPPPQAREVIEQLDQTVRSLNRARELSVSLDRAERYRRLVVHNEDRVNRALVAINPNAVSQMQTLETQRRENDDHLLQLAAERAALRQQLGTFADGTTEYALTVQLAQALKRTGVTEAELERTLGEAEAALRRAQLVLTQAQDRAAEARRELVRAHVEIRRAIAALAGDDQLMWIRSTFPQEGLPGDTNTPQQQLAAIDRARQIAATVNDRFGELRGQLGAVESALRGVGRHMRSQDPQAVQYLPELQNWMGQYFSNWFNNALVRHELLPTAEGDVVVNVSSRDVTWTEHGSVRSRPLEAFSSGEQAFAYTRARLAVLDEEEVKPANRLIVLDEFGAFIAHDLLTGLLAYLQERARGHPEDQVLVVLPLSRDYSELAKTAYGSEVQRFAGLAQEVVTRQYAVRPLVP